MKSEDECQKLMHDSYARIQAERAKQVAELRAKRVGPWAPACTVKKPRRKAPAVIVPLLKLG